MLELYVEKGQKKLRCGYTTGSCAAAAAKAASEYLLTGRKPEKVSLDTPKGIRLTLDVAEAVMHEKGAYCAIQKDSGDDPDITNGILVGALVKKAESGILIEGGRGVGRVTKAGLNQPIGAAAINSVPRRMIREGCEEMARLYDYDGGFLVEISIPEGERLAKRTFNSRLGVEGGLSVIGTTGIVEPMSNAALIDTIKLELNTHAAAGEKEIMLTPGNYGEDFTKSVLLLDTARQVICSNFIGEAIDEAMKAGFVKLLLIGHIGKLVKLGIGMFNTHSAYGDGRMEILIACALKAGASTETLRAVLTCVSTDAAISILQTSGDLTGTMEELSRRINDNLNRRVPDGVEIGFVCFTNEEKLRGVLAQSENAEELMKKFRRDSV